MIIAAACSTTVLNNSCPCYNTAEQTPPINKSWPRHKRAWGMNHFHVMVMPCNGNIKHKKPTLTITGETVISDQLSLLSWDFYTHTFSFFFPIFLNYRFYIMVHSRQVNLKHWQESMVDTTDTYVIARSLFILSSAPIAWLGVKNQISIILHDGVTGWLNW